MRKPFLTFDRVAAALAVAIAIVATLVVTLPPPARAGVVSAPGGGFATTNTPSVGLFLRTDGTLFFWDTLTTAATNAQPSSPNLTNWANLPTNVMANAATATFLSNWVAAVSNLVQTKQVGSDGITNLSSLYFNGTGSPEGAIAARLGAIYVCTNSCSGGVLYSKTNGTGNTGWWQVQWGAGGGGGGGDVVTSDLLGASNTLRTTTIANDTTTSNGVMSQLTLAASNRVQLAGGTGGITVSQSGSGGVQTWIINDDDAGGGGTIVTNASRLTITNSLDRIVGNYSDATNIVIPWGFTNVALMAPSNNAWITMSGSPPSGIYREIDWIIVLTNGQTSIMFPFGDINGGTNVALLSSPSTNKGKFISDGTRQWASTTVTLATGTGNHVMLSNAPVVTGLTLAGVATNSIPYIGGGGVVSTAQLIGVTLSAGVLTASGTIGAASAIGEAAMALPGLSYGPTSWRNYALIEDEFHSGGTSSGTIGQLSWASGNIGTGPGVVYTSPSASWDSTVFGCLRLAGGSSVNSGQYISTSTSSGAENFYPKTNWGFTYRIQLSATNNATDTNRVQLGWIQSPGPVTYGANGIFFRYDPAATQWQGVVRIESAETIVNCTSPVLASTWYSLSMEAGQFGTNFIFSVNGVPEATNTAAAVNYGSGRYELPFASITHSNGAASANLFIEYANSWRMINR